MNFKKLKPVNKSLKFLRQNSVLNNEMNNKKIRAFNIIAVIFLYNSNL